MGKAFSFSRQFKVATAAALLSAVALAGCNEQGGDKKAGAGPAAMGGKPEVGVVELHPQSVAITAELPGRVSAALIAEVRPQVSGIVKERLFREGSEVEEGQLLYQIDDSTYRAEYDSALANLEKAEASVPSAQTKLDRYQDLIKQNAVAKQDLDDTIAALAEAKADVAAAKAAVEAARINLDNTKIKAPISGRIEKSSLTVGALVTANQTTALTTIRQLDPINVDVTQSSTNLLNLRKAVRDGRVKLSGDNVQVRLKLETGEDYSENGRLEFSEAYVDETTGTYTLRAEFPNPDRLLLPGMYARAIVEEGVAQDSFLVPQRGVSRNTRGEAVALFVNDEGKVEERILDVKSNIGTNWLVSDGIKDGERVIVEGSLFVRSGQEVTTVPVTIDETTGEVRTRGTASGNSDGK
ncbi:efflux RND transporter periplasmic adaptor subunit [Roseibium suaedae]|uniref:Membrane fusion protein, multidrug efflux system n=1 Tax=Roseibium suaedae TaxID=735517 RepID=A0A1M7I643_9HYPH|nr:efflux RND transporter periplasmic adaptor subunit [Roseibium suaedae]SHM35897.1 membrane fusion protein, multidrug efflux system [Roseibium suaedae]